MFKKLILLTLLFLPITSHSQVENRFMNFVENHFSAGGGVHVLTFLPGPHGKVQFYPINLDRFKVYGELRGELVMAPILGSNYNIQGASRITENIGFHAGFGRWTYLSVLRKDPENTSFPVRKVNSYEFGITWLGEEEAVFDFYTSIPIDIAENPLFIIGGSATLSYVWWNKREATKKRKNKL